MGDRFIVKITMPYTKHLGTLIHEGELKNTDSGNPKGELHELLEAKPPDIRDESGRPTPLPTADLVACAVAAKSSARNQRVARRLEHALLHRRRQELAIWKKEVRYVDFPEPVAHYIARLVYDTWSRRSYAAAVGGREEDVPIPIDPACPLAEAVAHVTAGASPRAAFSMRDMALSLAWAQDGPGASVTTEHVNCVATAVLRHRLTLDFQAAMNGVTADSIISDILRYRRMGQMPR
jgi:hypothetical protein